jgi:2'-5' RNA ligase
MGSLRLFLAIDFPAAAKDAALAVSAQLRDVLPDARWIPRDNLHVTTKFLGWVPEESVNAIAAAASDVAGGMLPFDVRLGEPGAFPSSRRARVLWLGVDDPAGGFGAVAAACEEALEALGFAPERRAFVPHLTLARLPAPRRVEVAPVEVQPVGFTVDRLTLFRSHLRRPAPRYEELAVYPFGLSG